MDNSSTHQITLEIIKKVKNEINNELINDFLYFSLQECPPKFMEILITTKSITFIKNVLTNSNLSNERNINMACEIACKIQKEELIEWFRTEMIERPPSAGGVYLVVNRLIEYYIKNNKKDMIEWVQKNIKYPPNNFWKKAEFIKYFRDYSIVFHRNDLKKWIDNFISEN